MASGWPRPSLGPDTQLPRGLALSHSDVAFRRPGCSGCAVQKDVQLESSGSSHLSWDRSARLSAVKTAAVRGGLSWRGCGSAGGRGSGAQAETESNLGSHTSSVCASWHLGKRAELALLSRCAGVSSRTPAQLAQGRQPGMGPRMGRGPETGGLFLPLGVERRPL